MEVMNGKFSHINSKIFCEDEWKFNAPHHFNIETLDGNHIASIDFQEGPISEVGINGVSNEDLLIIILTRLEAFQMSQYRCIENQEAITAINEALDSLRTRTVKRVERGVEGTSII